MGFLGLLGTVSLTSAWHPMSPLNVMQPLILETAFSHLILEMLFNGIAIPAMCASEVDDRASDSEVHTGVLGLGLRFGVSIRRSNLNLYTPHPIP